MGRRARVTALGGSLGEGALRRAWCVSCVLVGALCRLRIPAFFRSFPAVSIHPASCSSCPLLPLERAYSRHRALPLVTLDSACIPHARGVLASFAIHCNRQHSIFRLRLVILGASSRVLLVDQAALGASLAGLQRVAATSQAQGRRGSHARPPAVLGAHLAESTPLQKTKLA